MTDGSRLRGVVFDWAGTIVDFGSLAPMGAFVNLFERHGIEISIAQARIPMGLPKLEHIRVLARLPEVAQQWQARRGHSFNDADALALLLEFEPMSAQAAMQRSDFIPGFLDLLPWLQERDIRVSTTTGYTRKIMRPLMDKAQAQGFLPDLVICCDDVAHSRPDPMGMYACMQAMGLSQQGSLVVKVDDTAPGLAEGRNAGCWTVGVAASGNAMGWSLAQWLEGDSPRRQLALDHARQALLQAGAHEVIDTVAQLPLAIDAIEQRMKAGGRP